MLKCLSPVSSRELGSTDLAQATFLLGVCTKSPISPSTRPEMAVDRGSLGMAGRKREATALF